MTQPLKIAPEASTEKQSEQQQPLDTVQEVPEHVASEIFDRPTEEGEFVEIPARIFGLKEVLEPLTIPSLNNAIYELGVVNMCWPEINEPVFETRTCFPASYYTNSTKERLLLAYAENFRRQYHFHFQMRKPLLLQVPNECGLQVESQIAKQLLVTLLLLLLLSAVIVPLQGKGLCKL